MTLALVPTNRRRLPNWITTFCDYTENYPSPLIFRKWAAISTIAASLEQKVWIITLGMPLYPNLYTALVGPPGAGKTLPIIATSRLFASLKEHYISPSSISNAALTDCLSAAKRKIIRPTSIPQFVEFNSLYVVSRELGVLLPSYDTEFMSTLNDLYDCGKYSQRRRGGDLKIEIPNAQVNLLAATTASYLSSFFPEGAWTQGFASRVIFIYSGAAPPKDIFNDILGDDKLLRELTTDLEYISGLFGKMEFDSDAVEALRTWHLAGGPPIPEHPKLASYVSRRTEHLLKLCMVAAVERQTADMTITLNDYQTALGWLLEVEYEMPNIFLAMRTGGDTSVVEETWGFVWQLYGKEKQPIAEHRLIRFIHERTPSHNVERILGMMVKSKLLVEHHSSEGSRYSPAPKVPK